MNFEQLDYVKAIIECNSITKASENLHISQSAMSQAISSLENEIGHKLFIRSKKGTFPTEEGKKLIPMALEIIEAKQNFLKTAYSFSKVLQGELKIATTPSLFMTFLPHALAKFRKDYPEIKIKVIEKESDEIRQLIKNKEIDIGLLSINNSIIDKSIVIEPLRLSTKLKAVVSSNSKFSFKHSIKLKDIENAPLILFDREFYNEEIRKYEKKYGNLNILFNTKNPSVLFRSVSEGLGISIVSELMLENEPYFKNNTITSIPMGTPFEKTIDFGLIFHIDNRQKPIIERIYEYLI